MDRIRLSLLAALLLFVASSQGTAGPSDVAENELGGVAGFIEGQAAVAFKRLIRDEGPGLVAGAVEAALLSRKGAGSAIDPSEISGGEFRSGVLAAISGVLKQKMVEEARRTVSQKLFGDESAGAAGEEAAAIADRAAAVASEALLEIADRVAEKLYDSAVEEIRRRVLAGTAGILDPTRLRESIGRAFDSDTAADVAERQAARIVGDSTAAAIRFRLEEALGGRLPPEVVDALERGPKEFERYASIVERSLPGSKLRELVNSVLNRPIVKLPSAAYAAILAGSAAVHLARAYNGVTVDLYELKRAAEVTRVMAWQIENREWINLSVMQIAGIARSLAGKLGAAASFEAALAKIKKPLKRIQGAADRIDELIKKPIDRVRSELDDVVGFLREELESMQRELLRPLKVGLEEVDRKLDDARDAISGLLPEGFDGLPPTWDDAKKKFSPLKDRPAPALPSGPEAGILEEERVPATGASESEELDPVLLHNGEFVYRATDLVIPGRGIDFRFTRTCRGRSDFAGELGRRCTHSLAERFLPREGGATYIDETGLKHFFARRDGAFVSPPGLDARAVETRGGFELHRRGGLVSTFESDGRLAHVRDTHGNRIALHYRDDGLLVAATDALGRKIIFERRADGLIESVRDFAGRVFSYRYDDGKRLIGATSPATADFPSGKTTAYRHDGEGRISVIVDPLGRPYLKNRYDDMGRVTAQSYGEGPWMTVQYESYGERGLPLQGGVHSRAWVTDAVGAIRLYEHDLSGRLLRRWRYDDGRYVFLSGHGYDESGRKTFDCVPSGLCRIFKYGEGEGLGEPAQVETRPAGGGAARVEEVGRAGLSRRLNAFGQVVEETDAAGAVVRYAYYAASDPDGDGVSTPGAERVEGDGGYLKSVERNNLTMEFSYDPVGNIVSISKSSGEKIRLRVNALNQVVKEEKRGEPILTYAYDAGDNLVRVGRGGERSHREFVYDRLGRLEVDRRRMSHGAIAETRYERDAAGRLTGIVMPEGNRIAFENGPEGERLCAVRGANSPEASRECVERNSDGEIVAFVDGEGFRTAYERNGFGEVVEIVDPLGNRAKFDRDASGRVTQEARYDSMGKLLSVARLGYDGEGRAEKLSRLLWRDDPTRSRSVDANCCMSAGDAAAKKSGEAAAAEGERLGVEFNANGLVSSITYGAGMTTRYFYDSLDRLVLERYPNKSERRTAYDRRGKVVKSIDRSGNVIDMEYDAAGRLTTRRATPAPGVAGTRMQRFEYDGLGRLVFALDENGPDDASDDAVSRFVYDSLSRPIAEESREGWITREFDDANRVVAIGLPSKENFYIAYDDAGRMQSIMRGAGPIASFEYDGSGALLRESLGENLSLDLNRDAGGRISSISYVRGGDSLEGNIEIQYGADGRVAREAGLFGLDRIYRRDAFGRLTIAKDGYLATDSMDAEMSASVFRSWRYEYDASGLPSEAGFAGEGAKQKGASFDAGGNLASNGELAFAYDSFGRLVTVANKDSVVASYFYDAFDRRIAKKTDDGERRFAWDGFRLVVDSGGPGPESSFAYGAVGNAPIAAVSEGGVWYLLPDRLGSFAALADGKGRVTARCGFGPYGERVAAVPDKLPATNSERAAFEGCGGMRFPFGFAGHVRDDESELVYMRYRYYSPALSRFITPDPLGHKVVAGEGFVQIFPSPAYHSGQGGASRATLPNRPLEITASYDAWPFGRVAAAFPSPIIPGDLNLYSYANGDPSTFVDPLGLASLVFDRSSETLDLVTESGWLWGRFSASNRAVRPNADPLEVGGNGPFPNGTYSIGLPEFYSEFYRDEVVINYELGMLAPWETMFTGRHWKKDPKSEPNYSAPYGRIRIRAGSPSDGAVWSRGLFIHGGRHDYRKKTLGCIRVDDADLELMAVGIINLARGGDPVTAITVQD